ncbi:MAG: marine proteobacterial sortase target protein [Pseudomonadota bacterium]
MHRRQPTILQRLERTSQRRNPELHRKPAPPTPTRMRWQDRLLITLTGILSALLLLVAQRAEAQGIDPWGLTFEAGNTRFHQLALDTSLHAEVTGLLARIHVVQRFRNDSEDWAEGTYRFPLPDGAAVDRLFIRVGARVLEGEIRERESAERVYRQARDEGRAAGLVSQERANQFSTRMANIGPGDTVDVMIGYLVKVDYRDGAFHLRLPMTFTARHGGEPQPGTERPAPQPQLAALGPLASLASVAGNASHRLELKIDLDAGVPLANVESLHHDVDIQPAEDGYTVRLVDPDDRMDRAFELRWAPEYGAQPQASLTTFNDGEDIYAQLMLVPPRSEALVPLAREVIFVVDTSGSMEGASLAQARDALAEGLDALTDGDRFNLLQFNSETEVLFPEPVAVNADRLGEAFQWLDRLSADGGTNMGPALEAALARPNSPNHDNVDARHDLLRQVVFITDGAVGNEQGLLKAIADQLGESRLFTIAIGSAPNAWFMRKAAEIGRGHYTFIGRPEDVADTMSALWQHLRLPAVSDVCVDWGMRAETYPEIVPDLYAGQPLWVVARLPREPDQVEICGTLNGDPWIVDAWPRVTPGPDLLSTLWAKHKVDALQESTLFGAEPAWVRAEVTRVALDHELLTPYTSLVAVDRQPSRPDDAALAAGEIPGLLPAGSTGAAFPATATGWKTQLSLSLLVLAISTYLFLRPFAPVPLLRRRRATRL